MAELAALGVAANVAQFVTLGLRSAAYFYKIYNGNEDLINERCELDGIIRNIHKSAEVILASSEVQVDEDTKELVNQTRDVALGLEEKLSKLNYCASKGGRRGKLELAWRVLWSKSDIEHLEARLIRLRDQVVYQLIALSHKSQGTFIGGAGAMSSKMATNNGEATKKLDVLYEKLSVLHQQLQQQLESGAGHQITSTLETMALEAEKTSRHCLLRQRVEKILQSLRFDDISTRKSDIPQAHRNTFQWSLSDEKASLATWLRSGQGIYWIEGKAGSGKSTLMKYLQSESRTRNLLDDWARGRPLLVLSHYFWAPGTDLQRSLVGLFRTLLFQIFLQDPELLERACPSRMEQLEYHHLEPWTLEELRACFDFLSKMETLPSKLCIFIDGLDEYQDDHGDLTKIIRTTAECKDIKLCVSSRPWVPLGQAFGHLHWKLCVESLTEEDIKIYIRNNLEKNAHFASLQQRSPKEAVSLSQELAQAADGVFLWVFLATKEILRGLTNDDEISELRERLRDIPRDLEDFFRRMLYTIDRLYHFETSALFSMLVYTQFSLTTHLTWAHRRSIYMVDLLSSPTSQYDFDHYQRFLFERPHENFTDTLGNKSLRGAAKSYDANREKHTIIARCKDLVHVSEELDTVATGEEGFKIGFLHRTVADFLALPKTKEIIDERLRGRLKTFLTPAALAHSYIQLLKLALLTPEDTDVHQHQRLVPLNNIYLWVIYLAKQTRTYSVKSSNDILFCLFALTSCYRGGLFDSLSSHECEAFPEKDVRFSQLISCIGLDTSNTEEGSIHKHNTVFPNYVIEKVFRMLKCGECLAIATPPEIHLMLDVCLQRKWDVLLGEDYEVYARQQEWADMETVTFLVMALRSKNSRDQVNMAWARYLGVLRRPQQSDSKLPSNLCDICRVFIRNGAPRFIHVNDFGISGRQWRSTLIQALENQDQENLCQKGPSLEELSREKMPLKSLPLEVQAQHVEALESLNLGTDMFYNDDIIDATKILRQIQGLGDGNGMLDEFVITAPPERPAVDVLCPVSHKGRRNEWWKWRPWRRS